MAEEEIERQLLLAREVAVDRALGDRGRHGDLLGRGLGDAARHEQRQRGALQPRLGVLGFAHAGQSMRERSLGKAASAGSQNQRQSSVQSVAGATTGDASLCTSRKTVKARRMYMRPSLEMSGCSLYK